MVVAIGSNDKIAGIGRIFLDDNDGDNDRMASGSLLSIRPGCTGRSLARFWCTSQLFIRHGKPSDLANSLSELWKRDPGPGINGENTLQDLVAVVRDGQDVWQEFRIVNECSECIVIG